MKRILLAFPLFLIGVSCGQVDSDSDSKPDAGSKSADKVKSADKGKSDQKNQTQVTIDGPSQNKAGITVQRVETTMVPEYLTASGQIVMNEERSAHIGVYTDGRITEIHANIGDPVHKGMVLARMHSHDVHETRAAYESAMQGVSRQKNTVAYLQRMRDRMLRLYDLKSASRQEVERSESDLKGAQTDLANAQIAVDKEVAHLTDILNLPASELPSINEQTEQVPVVSPVNGVVIDRKITAGSVVEPGQEVFTIADLTSLWMLASVNESDISRVREGDKAVVVSQAFPGETFPGVVTHLGSQLDPTTRTLQVRILLPNPQTKLRGEMYVTARICEGNSKQSIFVPEEAVQEINGGSFVFLLKPDNVFEATPVQVAQHINGQSELSSGLRPGDSVVVKGSFVVKSEMLKSQIGE